MSIRYKIALLFAGLVILIYLVISPFIYLFSARESEQRFNTRLKNRAFSTARVYAETSRNNFTAIRQMDSASVASLYEKSITVVGSGNIPVYQFSDIPGDSLVLTQKIIERAKNVKEYFFRTGHKKAVAIHYTDVNNNFLVSVAAYDADGTEYLHQLRRILLVTFVFSVLLSFLAGIIFARTLINPLSGMMAEVNLITSRDLSQRIQVAPKGDELSKLAQTFNELLDRMQDSFAIQRRFISNASHELSTPLTSISSQLEVAMQKDRSAAEYREVIQSVYEDIRELHHLTRSLLDIAKTGSQGSLDLNEVRLDEVLLKVAADVQNLVAEYKVNVDFEQIPEEEELLTVFGNANLLYIALKNIIENGCKYADNNRAEIRATFTGENIIIDVRNKGDVIAEADIRNIFQPFFRAGSAKNKQGFGLGLTLTRRILSLHKGTVSVKSDPETGTLFTITIPNILQAQN